MAKKKKERSSAPKLGASYQAAKLAVQVGGPIAYQALTDRSQAGFVSRLKSSDYHKGVAVSLLDQWGSKKLGHAAALSRKSVTAWAPEVLAGVQAGQEANLDPIGTADLFVGNTSGYRFQDNIFHVDRVKGYAITKYGLGLARKVVNKTRIAEPVKNALSLLGVTL